MRAIADPAVLLEVVTPRANAMPLAATARLLAACGPACPFSLEIAASVDGCTFLVRARPQALPHLKQQFAGAYPQAILRQRDLVRDGTADPAHCRTGEHRVVASLRQRRPSYLPLRTYQDDPRQVSAAEADPLLGIVAALSGLPPGWRALTQLVLHVAPEEWSRPYEPLALDRPREPVPMSTGVPSGRIAAVAGAVVVLGGLPAVADWFAARDWLALGLVAGGVAPVAPALVWLHRWLAPAPPPDPRLVREKLAHPAFHVDLRLTVVAPQTAPLSELQGRLREIIAAFGQFTLPTGNSLVASAEGARCGDLTVLDATPPPFRQKVRGQPGLLLNVQELAGLWHLPSSDADIPRFERTAARRWHPLPMPVAVGCRIGTSDRRPVCLSDEVLRRHLLLVAKTRRGKSSLLLRLAEHVMAAAAPDGAPSLVLVDPHHDLARAALGLVPAHRQDHVVYLDLANTERPMGLNLLDVGLGWDADRAVANALSVFRQQWDQYWGPRMEDIFRMVLLTLYMANAARCAGRPSARTEQYTVLEVPLLLADPVFRQQVVTEGDDPFVKEWWQVFYDRLLDRRLQIESINPVLTKINRLAASKVSRCLVGQPCSTILPAEWLRAGQIVIVHTAQGIVGDDTAALLGGTILNLLKLEVQAQAALPPGERRRVVVVVDELHTIPGADYEAFLGELAKYGANLVLATQTLARLEAIDRAHERALRATLFANLDGLFAFHCSAEDARYLVPELGGDLDVDDLVSLGEHQCYARLSANGERLPVFSLALDPPPVGDPALAKRLALASAKRYGRPREVVEATHHALHDRVSALRREAFERALTAEPPRRRSHGRGGPPDRAGTAVTAALPLDDVDDRDAAPAVPEAEGRESKR